MVTSRPRILFPCSSSSAIARSTPAWPFSIGPAPPRACCEPPPGAPVRALAPWRPASSPPGGLRLIRPRPKVTGWETRSHANAHPHRQVKGITGREIEIGRLRQTDIPGAPPP